MGFSQTPKCLFFLLVIIAPDVGQAQGLTVALGDGEGLTETTIQFLLLISVLSIAPGILITITCFPFIVTVLSILRQALGLQQSPPNMLIVSLALFLTYFVMEPIFTEAWSLGVRPLVNEEIEAEEAFLLAIEPFKLFMTSRVDLSTLDTMMLLRFPEEAVGVETGTVPLSVLVPSFLLSEVARAFQVGFLIFLPFLIIDLVAAAVLMSMGMMMVPPAIVSLPFKLAFFVIADGWALVSAGLVEGYF